MKHYTASVWFGQENGPGQSADGFQVEASNLVGAAGRAARMARKKVKGKFSYITVNISPIAQGEE